VDGDAAVKIDGIGQKRAEDAQQGNETRNCADHEDLEYPPFKQFGGHSQKTTPKIGVQPARCPLLSEFIPHRLTRHVFRRLSARFTTRFAMKFATFHHCQHSLRCQRQRSTIRGWFAGTGGERRACESVSRNAEYQFCSEPRFNFVTICCQRSRRSSMGIASALTICSAILSTSCVLTRSAAWCCLAAPANVYSIRTPGSTGFCAAMNSLATRFMPSRKGVTKPTSAVR
jgi:hypothetical protein